MTPLEQDLTSRLVSYREWVDQLDSMTPGVPLNLGIIRESLEASEAAIKNEEWATVLDGLQILDRWHGQSSFITSNHDQLWKASEPFHVVERLHEDKTPWIDIAAHMEQEFNIIRKPEAWRKWYGRERKSREEIPETPPGYGRPPDTSGTS